MSQADYKVADIELALGAVKKSILPKPKCPLDGIAGWNTAPATINRRAYCRMFAYDHSNGGVDRDTDSIRCRGALVVMQHFFDPGSRRRRHSCCRHSGFAWKGETEAEAEWCIAQTIEGPNGWRPNMLLDDGGDLTLMMHEQYPELMSDIKACPKKLLPECCAFMKG